MHVGVINNSKTYNNEITLILTLCTDTTQLPYTLNTFPHFS